MARRARLVLCLHLVRRSYMVCCPARRTPIRAAPAPLVAACRRGLGVHGLWWGLVIINTCQGTLMTIIALRFDFNKEAAKAAARTLDPRRPAPALSLDGGGSLDVACRGSDPMGREHSPGSSLLQPLLGGQQCGLLEGGQLAPAAPPVAPG